MSTVAFDMNLVAASGLSLAELKELHEIFRLVDTDNGGTISKEELGTLMTTLGIRASKVELETMINEIDVEGTGEIDFQSFVHAMSRKVQTIVTVADLNKSFKLFSNNLEDHEGQITMQKMISILCDFGDKDKRLTKEEAEDLINSVAPQTTQNGTFDYSSFIHMYEEK
ncbi:Calmodulin-3 [Clydaea vesicula]|uniref:Calmodulin-3 n=1 Tax=Clydaea vesicula TaxID=447962 RepID=A0AAD5U354_9FUNG|nr:Calmodulin-3 [Clydaea vesicula]KAJ3390879.1 Calmodulin-3 [Lobulomyces angularis]